MPIHRIIFRIDYKANFEIMNSPGTVMSLMNGDNHEYWQEFHDSSQTRQISGVYSKSDKGIQRRLTVDPSSINFEIEWLEGMPFTKLEDDNDYRELFKRVKALCTNFHINEFNRAGIRFIHLSTVGSEGGNLASSFSGLFPVNLHFSVQNSMGKPYDYGIAIDGSDVDGSKYHLKFGPYSKSEKTKYFLAAGEIDENLICDLDFYEESFAFANSNPTGWVRPFINKGNIVINELTKELLERIPNKKEERL